MGLFDFLFTKQLSTVLGRTYKVKIHGVKFELRKIHPLDFLDGSKAVTQVYATYEEARKEKNVEAILQSSKKIKEHYADVFLASVVSPKLVRKEEDQDKGIFVDNLFTDWDLANALYNKISEVSYGKKKLKRLSLQKND